MDTLLLDGTARTVASDSSASESSPSLSRGLSQKGSRWASDSDDDAHAAKRRRRGRGERQGKRGKKDRKEKKARKRKKEKKSKHRKRRDQVEPATGEVEVVAGIPLLGSTSPVSDAVTRGPEDGVSLAALSARDEGPVGTEKAEKSHEDTTSPFAGARPGPEPRPQHVPSWHGCRHVDAYERVGRIDEGTYGVVFEARCRESGRRVALKEVKVKEATASEGFPVTALREANIMLALRHPGIARVHEMVVNDDGTRVYMVMDHYATDVKSLVRNLKDRAILTGGSESSPPFSTAEVKCAMQQIVSAIAYTHERWYVHRDLKTSNLLYSDDGHVVICDFGLARKYDAPVRPYTQPVVTAYYRPPELFLGAKTYGTEVDMWGVGCIMAELLTGSVFFKGDNEADMVKRIFEECGSPTRDSWPEFFDLPGARNVRLPVRKSSRLHKRFPRVSYSGGPFLSTNGLDLLTGLLTVNPAKRMSAADAATHPWFSEAPLPVSPSAMPRVQGREAAVWRSAQTADPIPEQADIV